MEKPVDDSLDPQLIASLTELHTLLLEEEDLAKTLERISGLVCKSLEGCDGAGLTLIEDSKPITAAASDEYALALDGEQYKFGEGPCLQAIVDHEVYVVEDTEAETRWPKFIAGAKDKGLRSSLSIPLSTHSPSPGALNMYSNSPRAFDDKSRQIAQLFADQAAVAISNAHIYTNALRLTRQLKDAVATREIIGKAIGILIERERITPEQAFEMLKKTSQESNVKLRDIAERIVEHAVEGKK